MERAQVSDTPMSYADKTLPRYRWDPGTSCWQHVTHLPRLSGLKRANAPRGYFLSGVPVGPRSKPSYKRKNVSAKMSFYVFH